MKPGTTLAGYRIARALGAGGMGAVYRARQLSLDRDVALKMLKGSFGDDPVTRERFLQEGRIAARIEHPNLVRVLDVGEVNGQLFIAFELVDGQTLRERLNASGPLSARDLVEVGQSCAQVLAALHAQGVLHRDLKPENLFWSRQRGVLVGDLGIAKVCSGERVRTELGAILGTPAYLAPEQISGQPASVASDLYALGIVLFECATGSPPFQSEDLANVLAMHLRQPAPPLMRQDLPAALPGLVARLLAKSPTERPASAEEVSKALTGLLEREANPTVRVAMRRPRPPSATVRVAPAKATASATSARPMRAAAVAIALLALVGGVAWLWRPAPLAAPAPVVVAQAAPKAPAFEPTDPYAEAAPVLEAVARERIFMASDQAHLDATAGAGPEAAYKLVVDQWRRLSGPVETALRRAQPAIVAGDVPTAQSAGRLLATWWQSQRESQSLLGNLLDVHAARQKKSVFLFGSMPFVAATAHQFRVASGGTVQSVLRQLQDARASSDEPRFQAGVASVTCLTRWLHRTEGLKSVKKEILALLRGSLPKIVASPKLVWADLEIVTSSFAALSFMGADADGSALLHQSLDAFNRAGRPPGFTPEAALMRFTLESMVAEELTHVDLLSAEVDPRLLRAMEQWDTARRRLLASWPYDARKPVQVPNAKRLHPEADRLFKLQMQSAQDRVAVLAKKLGREPPPEP